MWEWVAAVGESINLAKRFKNWILKDIKEDLARLKLEISQLRDKSSSDTYNVNVSGNQTFYHGGIEGNIKRIEILSQKDYDALDHPEKSTLYLTTS